MFDCLAVSSSGASVQQAGDGWTGYGEATMGLRMRMNVLAALMSFTFIAAIALGIV